MRTVRVAIVVALTCLFQCKEPDPLTGTQRSWVNEIETLSSTLSGSDPALANTDLTPFDYLADAKIVGLGEGSHGAREFFQIKHRIFQYLVEKHSFRAFAFEMDFAESMIFDDYIQGKTDGDLKSLMTSKMIFWTWQTQEVLELFQWMRTYNQGKPESSRIHLYGVDCQFPTYNADFLTQRISPVDPAFATEIANKLSMYKTLNARGDSVNYKVLLKNVVEIYNTIDVNKNLYLSRGMSDGDYQLAKQLARTIVQTQDVIYRLKISDYKLQYRDIYMAENAQWTSNFVGGNQKICLWAHNAHIKGDGNPEGNRMGYYLANALQNKYKRVGSTFATGTFNASGTYSISTTPLSSSTNFLLHEIPQKKFVINVANIPNGSPLFSYVSQYHGLLGTSATYNGIPADNYFDTKLYVAYDILVYFDTITPSQLFK